MTTDASVIETRLPEESRLIPGETVNHRFEATRDRFSKLFSGMRDSLKRLSRDNPECDLKLEVDTGDQLQQRLHDLHQSTAVQVGVEPAVNDAKNDSAAIDWQKAMVGFQAEEKPIISSKNEEQGKKHPETTPFGYKQPVIRLTEEQVIPDERFPSAPTHLEPATLKEFAVQIVDSSATSPTSDFMIATEKSGRQLFSEPTYDIDFEG